MERGQWIYWKVLDCCGGGGLGPLFNPGSRIKLAITSSSPLPFPLTPTAPQSVSVYITLPASACAPLQETWKRKSGKLNLQPITSPIAQYTCLLFFQSGGALIFYNGSLCSQCHVTISSIKSGSDQKKYNLSLKSLSEEVLTAMEGVERSRWGSRYIIGLRCAWLWGSNVNR